VGLIFFSYILSGLIINQLFKKSSKFFKYLMIGGMILIFIIDHQFIYTPARPTELPDQIYNIIKQDQDFFTVYQVPSIMRDGFVYFGDLSSLNFFIAQRKHGKPTLAGYAGRFPGYKTTYYMNDPFLGYIGRLMDVNLDKNPRIDPNNLSNWEKINLIEARKSIDFLDIKYIITDSRKKYASTVETVLQSLGFAQKMKDGDFVLWVLKNKINDEYLMADFNEAGSERHLGMGWFDLENGYRWSGQKSSILFNVRQERELSLEFEVTSFYQDQTVEVFLNQQSVGKVDITLQKKKYRLNLPPLKRGLNTINFIFEKSFQPQQIIENSKDDRELSARFYYVRLKE
jgi:hypothetical protein